MLVTAKPAPAAPTSQESLNALLCDLLPPQGSWSDDAYLWLTDHGNRLIEFTDGHVQELPVPTSTHQAVLAFLYDLFRAYLKSRRWRGDVTAAGRLRCPRERGVRRPEAGRVKGSQAGAHNLRSWRARGACEAGTRVSGAVPRR